MKVNTISEHIKQIGKATADVPSFMPNLARQTSEQIIKNWASSTEILPDYKKAYKQIIVADEWMVHTRLRRIMDDLGAHFTDDTTMKKKYTDSKFYEDQLLSLISKAYRIDYRNAKWQRCLVNNNCVFSNLKSLFSKMIWRKPLLCLSVELLNKYGDADSILASFGTIVYLAQNCLTAKRIAFNFILSQAHMAVMNNEKKDAKEEKGKFRWVSPKKAGPLSFLEAKESIYEMMEVYLDQHKEYALKSSVLEPTKFAYDRQKQEHNKNSNDVHGYNYPAAMVLSCLHVQLPLIPMMGDTYPNQGFMDVWDCQGDVDKLWELFKKPQNFGKPFTGMKKELSKITLSKYPKSGDFKYIGSAKTPKNIANLAVSTEAKQDNLREHIAKNYIERFAHFFSKEFFLQKCFEVLNQEAVPEYIGFPKMFQRVFEEYKKDHKDITEKKAIEWLYDEYFIDIQVDRVWDLFTYLGITKEKKDVRVLLTAPLGKTVNDWLGACKLSKYEKEMDEQGYDDLDWILAKATVDDINDMARICKITPEDLELLNEILADWRKQTAKKK